MQGCRANDDDDDDDMVISVKVRHYIGHVRRSMGSRLRGSKRAEIVSHMNR
jgi:hypothetical protein